MQVHGDKALVKRAVSKRHIEAGQKVAVPNMPATSGAVNRVDSV